MPTWAKVWQQAWKRGFFNGDQRPIGYGPRLEEDFLTMYEDRFTGWQAWPQREAIAGLGHPGVYVCALADEAFDPTAPFAWCRQIAYIGMTISRGGLRARLGQFDNAVRGRTGHKGADRVRCLYPDYASVVRALYVAVAPFPCDVASHQPSDLEVMGEVAQFEYRCLAEHARAVGGLPEFNDEKKPPKATAAFGRQVATLYAAKV